MYMRWRRGEFGNRRRSVASLIVGSITFWTFLREIFCASLCDSFYAGQTEWVKESDVKGEMERNVILLQCDI